MPFIEDIEQLSALAERGVTREVSDLELLAELHNKVCDFVASLDDGERYVLDGEVRIVLPDCHAMFYHEAQFVVVVICLVLQRVRNPLRWAGDDLRTAIQCAMAGFEKMANDYNAQRAGGI